MDRQFSSASPSISGPQAQRTKMVQDLYAALPIVERAVLDMELENQGIIPSTSGATGMPGSNSRDWDISMSWEDIPSRAPSARPIPVPPLPQVQIPIPILAQAPSPALNGRSQDSPRSKFGGFGVGTQAASALPPLNFNASSSTRSVAPIIAVSSVPKGNLAAQPSIPSVRQPLNASTTYPLLPQYAGRSSAPSNVKSLFDSAGRKQNAFYQPPPAPPPAPVPMFDEGVERNGGQRKKNPELHEDTDADIGMGQDADSEMGMEDHNEPVEEQDHEGLAYSVFGAKPIRGERAASRTQQPVAEARQVPPGAFVSDEEPEPDVAQPPPPPPKQTRRSTAKNASTKAPSKNMSAATRDRARAKDQDLGRSLPGSLIDSEDGSVDEGEDEDGDRLAPLPRRQAVAAEGMQTRRRSSRLSSSSEPESKPEKEKVYARTKTGTGRKRRP
ncbi:hypothetical protein B0H10DRAFT_311763 [Mycena sp. CBHHK59/15]|nr:hypothetical protein B0H10DRAFT_311763 [Mycena sp. CBHHK59/15]